MPAPRVGSEATGGPGLARCLFEHPGDITVEPLAQLDGGLEETPAGRRGVQVQVMGMETDEPSRGADAELYARCLADLEADRIASARRAAGRIGGAALRALALDQIRFVRGIRACLAGGDEEGARALTRFLIGDIKLKYEAALGLPTGVRTGPPSSRPGEAGPSVGGAGGPPWPDLAGFPPDIREALERLMEVFRRARSGGPPPGFSREILLHLGRIARRAWRRPAGAKGLSPLRASASEARIAGECLREWIEGGGGRLSVEDLSERTGLRQSCVVAAVRTLRQYLLQGSGWRMVGDASSGFAFEPEDPDILPADPSRDADDDLGGDD